MNLKWVAMYAVSATTLYAKELPSPVLADFANTRLPQHHINYSPACRDKYGGEFNEKLCNRTQYECDWKEQFSQKTKAPIHVRLSEELEKYLSERQFRFYLKLNDNLVSGHLTKGYYYFHDQSGLPLGTEANFFITIRHPGQIEVLNFDKVVLQDQITLKDFKIPRRKFRILKDDSFPEFDYLQLTLDGKHIEQFDGNAMEIFVEPGNHDVNLTGQTGSFSKSFTLEKGNEEMVISKNDLKQGNTPKTAPVFGLKPRRIEWSKSDDESANRYEDYFSLNTVQMDNEELFQRIDKITMSSLKGTSIDATGLFNFHPMSISVKSEKRQEYRKLINEFGTFTLTINGKCETASVKPSRIDYPVFATGSDQSKNIGKIIVEYNHRRQDVKVLFEAPDKKISDYRFNFGQDRCEDGVALLHLVREMSGKFVNLGAGPWGKVGWTQVPIINPLSDDYKFAFSRRNYQLVTIKKVAGKLELTSWSSDTKPEKETISEDELWESEDQLQFKCDYERSY